SPPTGSETWHSKHQRTANTQANAFSSPTTTLTCVCYSPNIFGGLVLRSTNGKTAWPLSKQHWPEGLIVSSSTSRCPAYPASICSNASATEASRRRHFF